MAHSTDRTARLTQAGLNLIQQALSIYGHDLRLVACNRRFREMFDLPEALVTPGAAFSDTIRHLATRGDYGAVGDIEEYVAAKVEQARAFVPHYMERTRPNGMIISVEGSPLPEGGWVTVYTDITAIRRQEELLRARSEELSDRLHGYSEELAKTNRELAATNAVLEEARRELVEMEARIRTTTEMVPAHIARLDLAEQYTYSNRRLTSLLPGSPSEIEGLTMREALGDETYAAIAPALARAFASEADVFEFTHKPSGRRIRVSFTPDIDAAGEVIGVYILSMDVTAEAQARTALMQTRKRELAAQLTSGMAHDFANLLTIILGIQAQLARMPELSTAAREMIDTIRAAALRGGVLLDRLAHISGPRRLNPVATDIAALFDDIRSLSRPALPPGIALDMQLEDFGGALMIEAGSLQDSLINLILNARDAIGVKGGRIEIVARPRSEVWAEFCIRDDGPGFSEEALSEALNPFFTTKGGGGGSGLGLSMVYDFVKLSGGQVRLANRPEGGAEVTLLLPLRRAPGATASRMVLLVEDIAELRAAIRDDLCALGHTVVEAASADEALALAELPGVEIVLSDLSLPGGRSGLDLLDALCARGHGARMLLMTSRPRGDPLHQLAAGRHPVLTKPFGRSELAAALETREAAE